MTFEEYQAWLSDSGLAWIARGQRMLLEINADLTAVIDTCGTSPIWFVTERVNGRLETTQGNPHDTVEACQHAAADRVFRMFVEAAADATRRLT